MSRRVSAVPALVVLLLTLGVGAAEAKKKPLTDLPLVWSPTTELGELGPINLTGLSAVKVAVSPFSDAREERELIGENREDAGQGRILHVTTRDDVAVWVSDRVRHVLGQLGVNAVSEGGDVVVSGQVRRFFVTETRTYQGDVSLWVTVATPAGKVLWEGLTGGAATRFGRSYKAENYYEVFSDSLLEAVHKLLADDSFRAALRQGAGGQ